jgi:signal transduction histidine kinase
MNNITYNGRVSKDTAEGERLERSTLELSELRKMGQEAINEVRETLKRNLPAMPLHHRDTIRSILSL